MKSANKDNIHLFYLYSKIFLWHHWEEVNNQRHWLFQMPACGEEAVWQGNCQGLAAKK